MEIIKKLFSEESDISIMRIMAVISLLVGAGLALAGKDASVISIFVYAAFGGKAVQRLFESKTS